MSLNRFSRSIYKVKNLEKYIGSKFPICRSSWETAFCNFCDNNPSILEWASEPLKIPYRDPLSGRQTVYVPDFLIVYVDKNMRKHVEVIEIKPAKQTIREKVGKNPYDQAQFVKNMAKWEAAGAFCQQRGIHFRVVNETDLFINTSRKK
jgi:hypothetical protein